MQTAIRCKECRKHPARCKCDSSGSMSCSGVSDDGTYRYSWTTVFGNHSIFFSVADGLVVDSPNLHSMMNPIRDYIGKPFSVFCDDRRYPSWPLADRDRLIQVTLN